METLLNVLHVVAAVFIVGPMAILPMTALRAIRAGNQGQVRTLARSTAVISYASIIVFLLGFGAMGTADPRFDLSVTTGWILASIIAYVIAVLLNLIVVVPSMRRAAGAVSGEAAQDSRPAGYPMISASSGLVTLLLVFIVVMMVWKP